MFIEALDQHLDHLYKVMPLLEVHISFTSSGIPFTLEFLEGSAQHGDHSRGFVPPVTLVKDLAPHLSPMARFPSPWCISKLETNIGIIS